MKLNILLLITLYLYSWSIIYSQAHKINQEKAIAVIIPSFNNSQWVDRNLESVLSQEYSNFKIFFIDDKSTDNTAIKAHNILNQYGYHAVTTQETPCYIKQELRSDNGQSPWITVIANKQRRGALENLWRAIHLCNPTDIVVTVDGDDWLIDTRVLRRLNTVYSDPNKEIWLTYGQFKLYPTGELGWCSRMPEDIIANNAYRKHPHIPSHLRTFYASLFHQVALKDLLNYDGFYAMAWDIPLMMIIEKAGERHHFFEEPLYMYNEATSLNDHKVNKQLQSYLARILRAKPAYERLEKLVLEEPCPTTDLLIFSEDAPLLLRALLESVYLFVKQLSNIHVIYKAKTEQIHKLYGDIQRHFCSVKLYRINNKIPYYIKHLAPKIINTITSDYVLLASDNVIVTEPIDLAICMRSMKKTGAYGFYLRVGHNIKYCYPYPFEQKLPLFIEVDPTIYAWNFSYATGDWAYPCNFEMTLYSTPEIKKAVKSGHYHHIQSLETTWGSNADFNNIGLCFEHAKAVKLLLVKSNDQYTTNELVSLAEQNFKLDIDMLKNRDNSTARIMHVPQFKQESMLS